MTRTHVVTGAGSGIGRQVALRLGERGDRLVLPVRSAARADQLAADFPDADLVVADLSDPGGLAIDCPPEVHSLVHAAGVVVLDRVAEASYDDWAQTLAVNLTAPALLTRQLLPGLRAARGTVVFVNSGSGLRANPGWASYAASKFGLRALADALREEEPDLRVTSVFPGRTATPMQERVHEQEGRDYEPSRWIDPATVAATILDVIDLTPDATLTEVTVRPGSAR